MLKLKGVEEVYYPTSIKEAVGLLRKDKNATEVVGGGLDISVLPNPRIKYLIFLDRLNLNYVKDTGDKIKIGAMSSITDMINSDVLKGYLNGKVREILSEIATELLRNQITVGGSLGKREPYSDIVTLLYGLNAKVVLSDGEWDEELGINDLYKENFKKGLKERIIKEVILEKYDTGKFFFSMKRHVRNATDIALLNEAILIEKDGNKKIKNAIVAVGARPKPAYLFREAIDFLKGKELSKELAEEFGKFVESNVETGKDTRTTAEYRAHLAGIFAKRIISESLEG